jgi:hypothetical protein
MRYRLTYSFGIALFLLLSVSTFAADKQPSRAPTFAPTITPTSQAAALFAKGETLSYLAKLNELPAGDGELRLRKEQRDGRDIYQVTAEGRTNELVDFLFRLRGTANGAFAAIGFSPVSFRLAYTEWDRPRELGVRYDPETKTLVGMTKKKDKANERSEPAAGVYDPFSALYVLRSRDLTPGSSHQLDVFTGKDRYQVVAHVVRKENVLLGESERLAVRLHLEGFKAADSNHKNTFPEETTLWVSPDATHVPLKLESFLPFGAFVVELNAR